MKINSANNRKCEMALAVSHFFERKCQKMSYLELYDLTKVFQKDVRAVDSASIKMDKGMFFTFLGPSGCGKTTTLRMIAGFETPTEGQIIMDGKDITYLPPEKKEIGMMFQNYALFPHMSVEENVAYGLKIKKMKKTDIENNVKKYLGLVGLSGYEKRKITQLSGGEQQRVALARSLATEPKILLLDEPLSNLDAKMRDDMRFELKRLQHELNITMIYVTHDQNEALMMSDRIAVFKKGKIQQIGTPDQIYSHPANCFVANFVGQTNLADVYMYDEQYIYLNEKLKFVRKHRIESPKHVSIRNENIIFYNDKVEKENLHKCRIKSKQFNGMVSYYVIEVEGIELNVTRVNESASFSPMVNDDVYIWISPDSVVELGD